MGYEDSGGELLQRLVPQAHVVKALNFLNATDMVDPAFSDGPPTCWSTVITLRQYGRPVPCAGNSAGATSWTLARWHARLTEALGTLWVHAAEAAGSYDVAFRSCAAAPSGSPDLVQAPSYFDLKNPVGNP